MNDAIEADIGDRLRVELGGGRFYVGQLSEVTSKHLVLAEVAHHETGTVAIRRTAVLNVYPAPPKYRAHVFFYPYEGYCGRTWTWCQEIDGEIDDFAADLPRCDSWADAFAKAEAWLLARRAGDEVRDA